MKKVLLAFLTFLFSLLTQAQLPSDTTGEIQIRFNRNIEFAGFVFFMGTMAEDAGTPGAKMNTGILKKDWFRYDLALVKRYEAYRNDPDLGIAAGFMERLQANDIFPLLMSTHNFPHAVLPKDIAFEKIAGFAKNKDSAEAVRQVAAFLSALNRFYQTISFDEYFQSAMVYYQKAISEIKTALPASGVIAAMEKFYEKRFASYTLLPSMTVPSGMAFGLRSDNGGKLSVYNLFGAFAVPQWKDSISLGFNNPQHVLELSVHEFGHSFANPVVNALPDSIISSKIPLFRPIQEPMDNQGYPDWSSCITEHFVRAGEVIIARIMGRAKAADDLLMSYVEGRKFIYLPQIIAVLEKETAAGKPYAEAVKLAALALY